MHTQLLAKLWRRINLTLLSRYQHHLECAEMLPNPAVICAIADKAPWEGPLLRPHRRLPGHTDQSVQH